MVKVSTSLTLVRCYDVLVLCLELCDVPCGVSWWPLW